MQEKLNDRLLKIAASITLCTMPVIGQTELNEQVIVQTNPERVEYYYKEGLAGLRERNWTQAIAAFEAASQVDANYRDLKSRMAETRRQLARQNQNELLSQYYTDGLVALQRKDYRLAINAFQHVLDIDDSYRDAEKRLLHARQALERSLALENKILSGPDVEQFYQDGLSALKNADYVNAFVNFKSVEMLSPNYKDTGNHLKEAKSKLSEMTPRAPARSLAGDIALAGVVALAIILPVLGVLTGSPGARARLYLLQGDYGKAATIYERLLSKNPTRLKLYPVLANIYLLEGRTDETAIKVFKMILQMNLLSHRRDDINAIVAHRFLAEGRKDQDAINVMEDALQVEMRKLEKNAKRIQT
jgi:tetratricopeptide (TPR) repeat protein